LGRCKNRSSKKRNCQNLDHKSHDSMLATMP
jgi:hypothetical protein